MKKLKYNVFARIMAFLLAYVFCALTLVLIMVATFGANRGVLFTDSYANTQTFYEYMDEDASYLDPTNGSISPEKVRPNFKYILVTDDKITKSTVEGVTEATSIQDALNRMMKLNTRYGYHGIQHYYEETGTEELFGYYIVDKNLPYDDDYKKLAQTYERDKPYYLMALYAFFPALIIFLSLLAFLFSATGMVKGQEGVQLNLLDKLYFELFTTLAVVGFCCFIWMESTLHEAFSLRAVLFAGVVYGFPLYAICMVWLLSLARRIRSHTFWKSSMVGILFIGVGRLFGMGAKTASNITGSGPAVLKVISAFVVFWTANLIFINASYRSALAMLLLFGTNALLLLYLCVRAVSFDKIRKGAAAMRMGDMAAKIDTRNMIGSMRAHAETLNSLGEGLNAAVAARMRSESFKTELVANVSHDIKTPLTSIINYVDLLQKQDLQDETAVEYLAVLDRSVQRLKTLTEDLVDLSKASTGNVQLQLESLNFNELLLQGVGEFNEKLCARGLQMRLNLPEIPLYIHADGRHTWRILENLLSNLYKYALEGSRVYMDVAAAGSYAMWTVKNISAEPLNITAEALMERFVRGDTARQTEGSGLGLSIAKSLTELQGGSFSISVDGDLFKTVIMLPVAPASPL